MMAWGEDEKRLKSGKGSFDLFVLLRVEEAVKGFQCLFSTRKLLAWVLKKRGFGLEVRTILGSMLPREK